MDFQSERSDPNGQQVMGAQFTGATPRPREPGTEMMEGEVNGPDYGAQRASPPRLPNGVSGARHGSPTGVEIESLPYSPMVSSGARELQAFSGEAWPAQPASVKGPRPDDGRTAEATPTALRWMHRLGDFLKSHASMETLTSVTRQQIVGQGSSGSGFVVHQQVHHTTSQPGTPTAPPMTSSTTAQLSAENNPPLFGRSARRAMEAWAQQAPLLYPAQRRDTATDGGSSGSIPRELVEEEVKRQVEQALRSQQQGMSDLQEENRRLREQLVAGSQSVPERDRALTSSQPVPERDRALTSSQPVPERDRALTSSQPVPERDRALTSSQSVPECDRAYNSSQSVPERDRAYHSSHPVPERDRAYHSSHPVPERDRAYHSSHPVPERDRAYNSSLSVPERDRAYSSSHPVPERDRAYSSSHPVPERRSLFDDGLLHSGSLPTFVPYQEGVTGGDSRVKSALLQEPRERPSRSVSWERRQSPSRSPTRQPSPRVRAGSVSAGVRGRFLRGGAGDLLQGLSDGDIGGAEPTEAAYRPSQSSLGATFGDYEWGCPPGLGLGPARGGGPGEDLVDGGPRLEAEERHRDRSQPVGPEASGPTPLDVLITGMSQLQQVLLKQKNETVDLEPKAVQELAKLPEYTPESGATDFQDYLYLAEQQIGSLSSSAGEWWQRTLRVAQKAYSEYQSLSPMKRLGVRVTLPDDLQDDRYKRLERKVASLMLSSLPKGVRDELVAHRVQGVHQILFRLMVVFQPGGAQDRAQLLKQLDITESSPGPAEAVTAIRRWYRLLQRAADLNIALPDESLQVKSLSTIVKRTADMHSDFKFRVALARTELQIDSRPSQANVMRFLQHLLAELEQLGGGSRKPGSQTGQATTATSTTTTATTAPTLKGLQHGADDKSKAKAPPPPPKRPCQWFGTEAGCKNGKACSFAHSWSGLTRSDRCLLRGSTKHRAKDCPTKDAGTSPTRPTPPPSKATAAALSATSSSIATSGTPAAKAAAMPPLIVPEASGSTTANGGQSNKMDQTKMAEILSETNKMLKPITQQQVVEQPVPAPPQDPLALIQQQLDEVRRLKVMVVKEKELSTAAFSSAVSWHEARLSASKPSPNSEAEEEALLDSGASHAYRPARSVEDASSARKVTVTLATGEERDLTQTTGGTLLGEEGSEAIVPMGQLVKLLGCAISWSPSKLTVVHPVHGRLQVRLRGNCPVVPVSQAMTLIAELEQARMQEFEKTIADLKTQVKTLRDRGREDWSWERHLDSLVETGDRTSMAGFLHTCPAFEATSPEVLLGLPEAIPLGAKEGWKLMKGLPWSRAKRKSCFQSDGWIVHLCAGDPRTRDAKLQETMRRAMWSSSLVGGDVLVEVDIASSRSMDVLQQQAVFRVLAWAALNGKIKAIIGGPPRHGFPAATGEAMCPPQRLKELKIMVRMLSLWYMAEAGRVKSWKAGTLKQQPVKPHVGFLLEHPAAQEGKESFFDLPIWKTFSEDQLMAEVLVIMNGRPTILGGNLDLWDLRDESVGALEAKDPGGSVWPMELVAHLAGVLRSWTGLRSRESLLAALTQRTTSLEEPATLYKFNKEEWKLHLQRDHLPYRRDCRVCIERASGKPHRRVTHPTAYSMAVDLAGPFRNPGVGGYKYLMVGCYRFPRLPGLPKTEECKEPGPSAALPGDGEDWLLVDGDEDIGLEVPDGAVEDKVEETGECEKAEEANELDKEVEALKELGKPLEFTSVYLARPMKTRKKKDALRAVQELYIQLRSNGLPLNRLHMDRAREFQTDALEAWAAGRDIEVTRTQGSDPAGNGTAERAVGAVKARVRVLLAQAKELSGASDEAVRTWWPFAAETAVAQHQAMAFSRGPPTVARFGSRVFTKRKGYGQGGRFDLLPRWLPAVYLGPARSVPGGHLVLTDEGNLWYTTNIRQFQDPPAEDETEKEDVEILHPPARRVRRKSSIVELAGGVGLMPGLRGEGDGGAGVAPGLSAIQRLDRTPPGSSSGDLVSDDVMLGRLNGSSESISREDGTGLCGDLAAKYLCEGRFSMQDCLEVLEGECFRKTKKQRSLAWGSHEPPPVHTTLGAYQRGPWSGITNATQRHASLTKYLVALFKYHCGEDVSFTSMTVARDLCTDAHKDRFNLRSSRNLVVTVGNFEGGGIWQEGQCEGAPTVSVQTGETTIVKGYVLPVKDRVVQVDPKKLHKTMPWEGGPKWTIIAHTVGLHRKLEEAHREGLRALGFVLPELSDMKAVEFKGEAGLAPPSHECFRDPGWLLQPREIEEEMWMRLWTRRVLDEEDVLSPVVPPDCAEEFVGVREANQAAQEALDQREGHLHHERYDTAEWMSMCRLTEGSEEVHGVEGILELQTAPLKVVYTVALEEVKQFIERWVPAIAKEADALIKAGALVPLSREEQRLLEASGKLVILAAKGVFTVKPPDQEMLVDENGAALPRGSPEFYKRKARLVICGNFQGKQAKEDSYAGGCQTDSLRAMLVHCAALKWSLASTDIRNAFILAPISEEDDEDDTVYGLYPPKVLQLAKVQYSLQLWRVDRALYGFRRSPRLWGRFRDKRLRSARIPFGDGYIYLRQHRADENIWSARAVGANGPNGWWPTSTCTWTTCSTWESRA